jgi:CBS domain-containing protein
MIVKAHEVMTTPVITVKPSAPLTDVAEILVENGVSAVPVVDSLGKLIGIVSEGDLLRRAEVGTERRGSWWLRLFAANDALAEGYIKAHARKAEDVMTCDVVSAVKDTPLADIATLFESKGIKRVPIIENEQVVGIVSRADLVRAFAKLRGQLAPSVADSAIRGTLLSRIRKEPWAHGGVLLNVTVSGGVVDLSGYVYSETERKAVRVAAETIPGVVAVNDELSVRPNSEWADD